MATSKCPGEEETTILMAKEELEALRTAFESGDIPQAASRLRELLASSESTRLEVGVTGESGAGKSSLINALRGLGAEDPGAALTGVVETTMQPSSYPHPQFPDVTLWDLPGAGCPGCPADKYLKQVDFGRYDFFLLVSPRRCGAVEARLASEILRQGKKFYFVRTKVDEDLAATRSQRPSGFSESMVLQEIRDHCTERLLANEVSPETVLRLYSQSSDGAMRVARAFERGIPVFGTLVAGGISFGTVYTMLQGCLNEMAEDAQRVRIKALEEEEEEESQPEVSLDAAGDNGVEKCGVGEGGGEEAPLSTRRKLGLLLKYILDSWKKRDLEEK
ncbi:PREDICTED: interferon-inducible GTPase 5 [Myotis brandtii]|uniref:interferon-inducible GTPase 5 n=1 Tax=Myotis brandtii TaxID=109478 RepID=UPI0003BBBDD8|nr:PREDICTED: interferon-inducible GTPase 5 [Myotis brandtii]